MQVESSATPLLTINQVEKVQRRRIASFIGHVFQYVCEYGWQTHSGMDCVTDSRLSKILSLSIASSVDSSQSNPSVSLNSVLVSITLRKVASFLIARIHSRHPNSTFLSSFLKTGTRVFSAFTRATCCESPFPSLSLINALSWASWPCSASCKIRDQGFKTAVFSWEEFVSWLFWESSLCC